MRRFILHVLGCQVSDCKMYPEQDRLSQRDGRGDREWIRVHQRSSPLRMLGIVRQQSSTGGPTKLLETLQSESRDFWQEIGVHDRSKLRDEDEFSELRAVEMTSLPNCVK